jgi:hypothetical protein
VSGDARRWRWNGAAGHPRPSRPGACLRPSTSHFRHNQARIINYHNISAGYLPMYGENSRQILFL